MRCDKCQCVPGNKYYLYSGLTCTHCGYVHKAVDVDSEYVGLVDNAHRFRLVENLNCRKCQTKIRQVDYPCKDAASQSRIRTLFGENVRVR